MVQKFIMQFHKVGPLTISEVQYDDYNLSLMGAGWSLNTTSSWRILSNDGLFGNHDGETKEKIKFLIGQTIVSINEFGEPILILHYLSATVTNFKYLVTPILNPGYSILMDKSLL
jgi:hypothetical protein